MKFKSLLLLTVFTFGAFSTPAAAIETKAKNDFRLTADELRAVRGEFTPSEFVKSITGVDNVCERAALRNAETLLVKKTARSGVTVAAAAEHWEVRFA